MIEISNYKPQWEDNFNQLKDQLLQFDKHPFLAVEHIGSTSIKNVKAKNIVDVQCAIQSFNDMPLVIKALTSLNFDYLENIKQDHVPFHDETFFSPDWEKRFFKGQYKGQDYNLHIRLYQSANWLFALQFRDYLSSHPQARYAYMQFKERLAASSIDLRSYCSVKDSVIDLLSLLFPKQ